MQHQVPPPPAFAGSKHQELQHRGGGGGGDDGGGEGKAGKGLGDEGGGEAGGKCCVIWIVKLPVLSEVMESATLKVTGAGVDGREKLNKYVFDDE